MKPEGSQQQQEFPKEGNHYHLHIIMTSSCHTYFQLYFKYSQSDGHGAYFGNPEFKNDFTNYKLE